MSQIDPTVANLRHMCQNLSVCHNGKEFLKTQNFAQTFCLDQVEFDIYNLDLQQDRHLATGLNQWNLIDPENMIKY